jgi:hypothetical protein
MLFRAMPGGAAAACNLFAPLSFTAVNGGG